MSGKQLRKLLEKNGWKLIRVRGSHHIFSKEAEKITVPIHANRDISTGTANAILKEAGIK